MPEHRDIHLRGHLEPQGVGGAAIVAQALLDQPTANDGGGWVTHKLTTPSSRSINSLGAPKRIDAINAELPEPAKMGGRASVVLLVADADAVTSVSGIIELSIGQALRRERSVQMSFIGLRPARQFLDTLCGAALAASLMILSSAHAGTKEPLQTLHVFEPLDGDAPGPLTLAGDGRFYGAAAYGGALSSGTVFAMDKRGTFEVLHAFNANVDGQYPSTTLLSAIDGYLYGTVRYGGAAQCGSLFRVSPSTGAFEVMRPFAVLGRRTEGCNPRGAMAQGPDGWIYGTTEYGGSADAGTVYKWNPHSGAFKTLRSFAGWGTGDGYSPMSVALSPSGELFGLTPAGGKFDVGTIYSLNPDGSQYRVVYSFTNQTDTIGSGPYGQLLLAKDGNFYGSTGRGGFCCGTIFRLSPDGTVSLVHTFEFSGDLGFPVNGDLALGPEGLLYGVTRGSGANGGGTVFTMSTSGEARVLQSFTYAGTPNAPVGRLARAGSYMYGVASRGFSEGSVIYRVLKK